MKFSQVFIHGQRKYLQNTFKECGRIQIKFVLWFSLRLVYIVYLKDRDQNLSGVRHPLSEHYIIMSYLSCDDFHPQQITFSG